MVINDRCETSRAGVFAAGDATTVPYKQIIVAAGEGAKAALSAFDHLIRTPEPNPLPAQDAQSGQRAASIAIDEVDSAHQA